MKCIGHSYVYQTRCTQGCSTNTFVTHSLTLFLLIFKNIINPKPLELRTSNFDKMATTPFVSCDTCHVSGVQYFITRNKCSYLPLMVIFDINGDGPIHMTKILNSCFISKLNVEKLRPLCSFQNKFIYIVFFPPMLECVHIPK